MFTTPVSRRAILKLAAASPLASPALTRAQQSRPAPKLILSAPLTHSDWMLKPNMSWGPAGVKHMLDACKECGWSHIYWRVFDAGKSTYKSKLLKPGSTPDKDWFYNPQTEEDRALMRKYAPNVTPEHAAEITRALERLDYSRFDSLAAAVEYGHKIGLKIWAWASINEDDHGWGSSSEFAKAHPQFRWHRRDGRSYHSQLSFAFEEVRQYKLGLIRELLAYPIDGLFLDWIRTGDVRDNPQTDPNGVADSGYEPPLIEAFKSEFKLDPHEVPNNDPRWVRTRAKPQTLFMRELRRLVHQTKRIPVAVMVGHPWHYRGTIDRIDGNLNGLLLDVATWAEEGLMDAAVAAGYYRDGGTPEMAYNALRKETGGKVDLWLYAWVPNTVAEFERDFAQATRAGAKRMLFWEADYIDARANAVELKSAMTAKADKP